MIAADKKGLAGKALDATNRARSDLEGRSHRFSLGDWSNLPKGDLRTRIGAGLIASTALPSPGKVVPSRYPLSATSRSPVPAGFVL